MGRSPDAGVVGPARVGTTEPKPAGEVAMSTTRVDGVELYYELTGDGAPLALVHGSWGDATNWRFVLPGLAQNFRVLTYDRRGHSRSSRPATPVRIDDDGDDLGTLLEALELAPAHVATISYGGNIALRLACRRPKLFRSLTCHEPPLFGFLDDDPDAQVTLARDAKTLAAIGQRIADGDSEGGARQFVEEVMAGPGAWDNALPADEKAIMVRNAPMFLEQLQDPDVNTVDRDALTRMQVPVRLTSGTKSPPIHARVIQRLMDAMPDATHEVIDGADHVPHVTAPQHYVEAVSGTWA
jgi:pimeloyl-ACP methyl ester carboxylesterase